MLYVGSEVVSLLYSKIFDLKLPEDKDFNKTAFFDILNKYLFGPNLVDVVIFSSEIKKTVKMLKGKLGHLNLTIDNDEFRKKYVVNITCIRYKKIAYDIKIDLYYDKYCIVDFYKRIKKNYNRPENYIPFSLIDVVKNIDYIHLIMEYPHIEHYSTEVNNWYIEYKEQFYEVKLKIDKDDISIENIYFYDNKFKLLSIKTHIYTNETVSRIFYDSKTQLYTSDSNNYGNHFINISNITASYLNEYKRRPEELESYDFNFFHMIAL